MLKVRPDNLEEASFLIDLLRTSINDDRPFLAGCLLKEHHESFTNPQPKLVEEIYQVGGIDEDGEIYRGVVAVMPRLPSEDLKGCISTINSLLAEKPFFFESRRSAAQIWPHKTLEDRVIDTSLFALAGYRIPSSLSLITSYTGTEKVDGREVE
ncbi:MAG: hypothetical protein HWE12_00260 [Oceanospirillaceae bacterium]|nr:hypothetical protein [Oceanospirillaceae bacterium]